TAAATAALDGSSAHLVLVCDGDLGASAASLTGLVDAVEGGRCDLAIAAFARRVGGGFGVALRFARWAIASRSGYVAGAPISGQRAMRVDVLRSVLPFAHGYGMEIGMTVDAIRAGYQVCEVELELEHRATGRTLGGFVHRGRQLRDFTKVWWARRRPMEPQLHLEEADGITGERGPGYEVLRSIDAADDLASNARPVPLTDHVRLRRRDLQAAVARIRTAAVAEGIESDLSYATALEGLEQLAADAASIPLTSEVRLSRPDFEATLDELRARIPESLKEARWRWNAEHGQSD
ncbi:MAG TPA: hypothetical protein VHF58_00905, partial [Solirubrobacterales bacterium]|nr:hypothetical protein [Solirubrobacterales bacterium]